MAVTPLDGPGILAGMTAACDAALAADARRHGMLLSRSVRETLLPIVAPDREAGE